MVRKRQVWDLCSIYEMFSPLLPIVLYKAGLLVSAYLDFFFFVFFFGFKGYLPPVVCLCSGYCFMEGEGQKVKFYVMSVSGGWGSL